MNIIKSTIQEMIKESFNDIHPFIIKKQYHRIANFFIDKYIDSFIFVYGMSYELFALEIVICIEGDIERRYENVFSDNFFGNHKMNVNRVLTFLKR